MLKKWHTTGIGVLTDLIVGTIGVTGGIDLLPLLAGALVAGGALNGAYSIGQAYDSYRYWRDYQKNTGFRPKYSFRAGRYDWMADAGHALYTTAYWFRS